MSNRTVFLLKNRYLKLECYLGREILVGNKPTKDSAQKERD